jgi:luciferase family oxidoreductase group 1
LTSLQVPVPLPIPVSLLDRSHLRSGSTPAIALGEAIVRANHAEGLGFTRFRVSEHHGVPGVAGAAPAVLLGALGKETRTIRLGSGGVMVPNHQPLVIVEQFGTLAALFPGRIDLDLGRSLGFVSPVRRAPPRNLRSGRVPRRPGRYQRLPRWDRPVTAYAGTGADIDVFVLASSSSAIVAAEAGLPLVAGGPQVLAPREDGKTSIDRYRAAFQPSTQGSAPRVLLNVNVLLADTDAEARRAQYHAGAPILDGAHRSLDRSALRHLGPAESDPDPDLPSIAAHRLEYRNRGLCLNDRLNTLCRSPLTFR